LQELKGLISEFSVIWGFFHVKSTITRFTAIIGMIEFALATTEMSGFNDRKKQKKFNCEQVMTSFLYTEYWGLGNNYAGNFS
jgi:hypothetical protein